MDQKVPQHIAIVMDGNGRWAAEQGLPRVEGHRMGVESIRRVVDECLLHQIPFLSLFAFSSENWARPKDEVDYLMALFVESIEQEMALLLEKGVRMCFTGDRSRLSEILIACMQSIESLTAHHNKLVMNIVFNYGGRWDIVQAARTVAIQVSQGELAPEDIDEHLFSTLLDTRDIPDPDLFIRTSGELRISNFFLWQLAYSELYFCDLFWPDFSKEAFQEALTCFAMRRRRFGKTGVQMSECIDV